MGIRDLWWNIATSSLVIIAASVFEIIVRRCGQTDKQTDTQTDRQMPAKPPTPRLPLA